MSLPVPRVFTRIVNRSAWCDMLNGLIVGKRLNYQGKHQVGDLHIVSSPTGGGLVLISAVTGVDANNVPTWATTKVVTDDQWFNIREQLEAARRGEGQPGRPVGQGSEVELNPGAPPAE